MFEQFNFYIPELRLFHHDTLLLFITSHVFILPEMKPIIEFMLIPY